MKLGQYSFTAWVRIGKPQLTNTAPHFWVAVLDILHYCCQVKEHLKGKENLLSENTPARPEREEQEDDDHAVQKIFFTGKMNPSYLISYGGEV